MFPFFGLTTDYKLGLHEEIFSLCYYGKGGFIWEDVYNLPIHLRRYYIQQISNAIEERNKVEQGAMKKQPSAPPKLRR
jgi:hypothetical protein